MKYRTTNGLGLRAWLSLVTCWHQSWPPSAQVHGLPALHRTPQFPRVQQITWCWQIFKSTIWTKKLSNTDSMVECTCMWLLRKLGSEAALVRAREWATPAGLTWLESSRSAGQWMYLTVGTRASNPLTPGQCLFTERQVFLDEVGGKRCLPWKGISVA